MLELIERIEALEGPDREVDCEIFRALNGSNVMNFGVLAYPNYTASLDAAMTLVPEGLFLLHAVEGFAVCTVGPHTVKAATPALALCAAALRARLQEDKD